MQDRPHDTSPARRHTPAPTTPSPSVPPTAPAAPAGPAGGTAGRSSWAATWPSTWPSMSSFYAADLRRARSAEVQLGSLWKTGDTAPPWRAGWLETTGELYVVRYVAAVDPDPGPVEVLGVLSDRFTLDVGLRGWWHVCGHQGSLAWLRQAVRSLSIEAAPPAPPLTARDAAGRPRRAG